MSDLIDRQAAIDLVESFYKIDKSVLKIMVFKLKELPSVQPETNCSEIPNSSDTISRQTAINAVHKDYDAILDFKSDGHTVANSFEDIINALPSVQPRKGKWIGYNADDKDWQRDDGSPIFMNCSECHEAVINNGSAHWNFCPNCGADMRGEHDESIITT